MPPLLFGSPDRPLFGVYDPPAVRSSRRRAAVLLQGFGHEGSRMHRTFVRLGRMLAALGIPSLRFDLPGCGDSWGRQDEPSVDDWHHAVDAAMEEVMSMSGAERVAVVGHRLGAWVALEAALRTPEVTHTVLWSPVLDGPAYDDLLAAERQHATSDDVTWVHGYPWSPAQRAELRARVRPAPLRPGQSALVILGGSTVAGPDDEKSIARNGATVGVMSESAASLPADLLRVGEVVLADAEAEAICRFVHPT